MCNGTRVHRGGKRGEVVVQRWNKSCQKNCSETIRQDPADVRHQDVTTRVKWTKLDTALQKTSQTTLAVVTRGVETAAEVTTTNTEPLSLLSLWRRGRKESEKNKRKQVW